ncbi:MAG: DUF4097 family beta strand repeat-containing protein [Terriglobales bacterium]
MKHFLNALLAILALALALTALPAALAAQQGSFHRQYQVNGPVTLEIHNGAGDVHVTALPGNTVTVDATIRQSFGFFLGSDPQAVQRVEHQPPITQDGNTIRISRIQGYWARHISIRYTITAPPDTQVSAQTGSGDVDLDGLQRPARLHTGSGDVHVTRLGGDLHASTGSGDIVFGSIQGSAHFSTGSGDIRGREIAGRLRADTGSGDVIVNQVGQGAYASTGSGSVHLDAVTGDVTAQTASGDVSVGGTIGVGHRWDLGTSSGAVYVSLHVVGSVAAQLYSSSGGIDVHLPSENVSSSRHSWSGTLGSGAPSGTLVAHSSSGGIVVH